MLNQAMHTHILCPQTLSRIHIVAYPQDLAQKLYSTATTKDSARFQRPKLSQTAFTIQHYAGPVTYETDNFLDKNKDFVVAEHQQLLQESTAPFVQELFASDPVSQAAGQMARMVAVMIVVFAPGAGA